MNKRKIINDPVHGFITIDHPLIFKVLAHPIYQRLRRIHQMALAALVYPGAVHSRFHHALGAYHLMGEALKELRSKGVAITDEEVLASKLAILLHDVGHGPYSHALEHVLVSGVHHEQLSLLIMQQMNSEMDGALDLAIQIFTNKHEKRFLYQLLSGQLDVDRMDYLTRDSFFTGVIEGSIGYDRIIKMLTVHNGELMVEEKGIYSIEKFLVARRLMYWQVYLHKTVLVAEKMLVNILKRAKEIGANSPSEFLNMFLNAEMLKHSPAQLLFEFCQLDDNDVMSAVKQWQMHEDKVLSLLCGMLFNRNLLKIKMQTTPFEDADVANKKQTIQSLLQLTDEEANYFVFDGEATNTTYDVHEEKINILFKDDAVKDISQVDNALIQQSISSKVKKYYLCYWK
jgi:uncharacterized protein